MPDISYAKHQSIVSNKQSAINKTLRLIDNNSVFSEMLKNAIENHDKENKILRELSLAIETLKQARDEN